MLTNGGSPVVPTSWLALLVLVVAVLPGAMFTFAFERRAGDFGVALADRVLRFVATSVVLDLVLAWPAYALYRLGARPPPWDVAEFATAWAAVLIGSALPFAAGSVVGGLYATRASRSGWRLLRRALTPEREARLLDLVVGRDPAPRGWDFYFSQRPVTYLRVRTRDGTWIGGLFAGRSSAGGFPQEGDLFIEQAWSVDDAGMFGEGPLNYSLYVPAGSISFVEIVEPARREEARDG